MRSIGAPSILLSIALLGSGPVEAQSDLKMSDPVFGIGYNTRRVHFDEVPKRIADSCPRLREERYWVYAYLKEGETEYLIVSSRASQVSGGGVMIRGLVCTLSLPDALLYGIADPDHKDRVITAATMHGLAVDLFRRYENAFGGKENFLREVSRGGLAPSDLPPGFRREFEVYAKSQ